MRQGGQKETSNVWKGGGWVVVVLWVDCSEWSIYYITFQLTSTKTSELTTRSVKRVLIHGSRLSPSSQSGSRGTKRVECQLAKTDRVLTLLKRVVFTHPGL